MAARKGLTAAAAFILPVALGAARVSFAEESDPAAAPPPAVVELTIDSSGDRLPGHAYLAAGAGPHPTVVLLHGFPGNERNLDLAQRFRRAGFNSVFFHYRGAWGAEGNYSIGGQQEDVAAVLRHLRARAAALRVDPDRLTLLGHSLGGFTALAAGRREAVVCVGAMAPANPALYRVFDAGGRVTLEPRIGAYADSLFMLAGFDAGVMQAELVAAPAEAVDTRVFGPALAGKSVMLVGGERDQATPLDTVFRPISERFAAVPGLTLRSVVLDDDHSFSASRVRLGRLLLDWLEADCS
ncbi:alpha/beta fold hydrolase [Pseudohaliea sp.]|uniref:alpha/beta hydrolase family protein n=1 Tax=Pseudohaliea sp. TaxID=2740289 RepID=UPI0032EC4993